MEKFLLVGEIVKPQGIKGEVKLKTYVDDVKRFKKLKEAYIDDKCVKVSDARITGQDVYLSFYGVPDRNAAELLRGKKVFVSRENAVELKEGSYFIADVIGSAVILKGETDEEAGVVDDIIKYSSDVYFCSGGGKKFMFPLLKDLLIKIDAEEKKVYLDRKRFYEVVSYED